MVSFCGVFFSTSVLKLQRVETTLATSGPTVPRQSTQIYSFTIHKEKNTQYFLRCWRKNHEFELRNLPRACD